MDQILIHDSLSNYCDDLLNNKSNLDKTCEGNHIVNCNSIPFVSDDNESISPNSHKKTKRKKKKGNKKNSKEDNETEDKVKTKKLKVGNKINSSVTDEQSNSDHFEEEDEAENSVLSNRNISKLKLKPKKVTDDGFRIQKHRSSLLKKLTDDGFKLVSNKPSDDSDVYDATTGSCSDLSDSEYHESTKLRSSLVKKVTDDGFKIQKLRSSLVKKVTDDGFKLVSNIPSDDSDVYDAFGSCSDLSDSEYHQSTKLRSSLLKIINDFGLENSLKKNKTPVKTPISNLNPSIKVLDYTNKRGGNKSNTPISDKTNINTSVNIINSTKKRGTNQTNKQGKPDASSKVMPLKPPVPAKKGDPSDAVLKKARFDVFKFGLTGFTKEKQKDTRIALAVSLGAKPPKKKMINYKLLMEQRKDEKEKKREEDKLNRQTGMTLTEKNSKIGKFKKNMKKNIKNKSNNK